jgi:hypothetical protein
MEMPLPELFTSVWQDLAIKERLNGIHFVGMHVPPERDNDQYG